MKLRSIGPPKIYFGGKLSKLGPPKGVEACEISTWQYIQESVKSVQMRLKCDSMLLKNGTYSLLTNNYCLECNTTLKLYSKNSS